MSFELYKPQCNGICVMGYEILEGASGVAYPHPDCEKHGSPPSPEELEDNEYHELHEECGGRQFVTGGNHWYNGQYDCYTMYLNCENCGPYEVECV